MYVYRGSWEEINRGGGENSKLRSRTEEGDQRKGITEKGMKIGRVMARG